MNLLVVSSLTTGTTAAYLIEAFRSLGCQVHAVSDLPHPLASELAYGLVDASRWTRRAVFDALLFIEGGTRRLFPMGMQDLACPTGWYAIDSHVHLDLHLATARLFDRTFVAQREFVDRFGDGARWVPLAADPSLFHGSNDARPIDIAYVGSDNRAAYPERSALLDAIRRKYPNVSLGRASPQEMGFIYGRAKVVFNKSVRNDVNMRYFEAMCAGAVLVTDRLRDNGVQELFEVDSLAVYEDEVSLMHALDRLLADDVTRERMGRKARESILARHTYRHRAEQMLAALNETIVRKRPGPDDYMPVFHRLRFPEGVAWASAASLRSLREKGDRNPVLALVSSIASALSWLLVRSYRLRYRLRHWRLARAR